jgi:hypothetical protein
MSKKKLLVIGCAVLATSAFYASLALAGSSKSSLRKTAVAWVRDMGQGKAAAACKLQVQGSVNGVACNQLPNVGPTVGYCEAKKAGSPPKRTAAQQVTAVKLAGQKGSAVILSSSPEIKFKTTLHLQQLGGSWRVSSLTWGKNRLNPAGLANEGPHATREKLWPVC